MVCPAARAAGQTHCHIGRLAPDKLPIAYTPAFAAAFRPCVYRGTHRMTPNAGRSQPVTAERRGPVPGDGRLGRTVAGPVVPRLSCADELPRAEARYAAVSSSRAGR